MIKFNILTESFVSNETIANQRLINAEEFEGLIAGSGSVLTFSGATTSLLIDLGSQKSVDSLYYSFSPTSLSGISVHYGRDLNNLYLGSATIVSSGIEVIPSQSGYTYPRYFKLNHVAASGNPEITANFISVYNNDTDIEFGEDGLQQSVTITSSGFDGLSQVYEIKIMNSGTIPSDIYVSLDTSDIDPEILDRFELAPTATGVFQKYNESLAIPDAAPWEWGLFNNVTIVDNKLQLKEENFTFPNFTIGTTYELINHAVLETNVIPSPVTRPDGTYTAMFCNANNALVFVDPIRNTQFVSSNPAVLPTTVNERSFHNPAWDGKDKLYYMNNSVDQTIRYYQMSTNTHHVLGTVPFYTRRFRQFVVVDDYLYVLGGTTSSGTDATNGTQFYKVHIPTVSATLIGSTASSVESHQNLIHLGNYIYYIEYPNSTVFARWDITLESWEYLALPAGFNSFVQLLSHQPLNDTIWLGCYISSIPRIYELNPVTLQYTEIDSNSALGTSNPSTLAVNGSIIFTKNTNSTTNRFKVYSTVPNPILAMTASGSWTSPVLKLDNSVNFHRLLLDYEKDSSAYVKFDNSISVDNFEIRGSNDAPSADNITQEFSEELSDLEFVVGNLNEYSLVTSSGNKLSFSHNFIDANDTEYNSAYINYGFPLNTTGKMQYKFWWNPSSNKVSGNSHFSAFYIVPFLDTLDSGDLPERNQVTFRRSQDNHIYLRFGQNSDSAGNFTRLQFYNGSTTTPYTINASTGSFYEVNILIDWDANTYSLYFAGVFLGNGTIPAIRKALIGSQHSYEIFSATQNIDAEEEFRYLTISRVGTLPIEDTNIVIPTHREDPIFGSNGNAQWFPVTVNSALIPKYDYIQFKLTLRAQESYTNPTVNGVKFPVVLVLKNVPAGQTKSIFVRYSFPASNNLSTNVIRLKAWMSTDKL